MRVIVGGQRLDLAPADVIGQGGEAIVYRRGDRAIKIYQGLTADALAAKADKLRDYPRSSPAGVIAPLALAHDTKGQLAGYAMRFLDGAHDGQRLASRKHREGVLGGGEVTAWLRGLAEVLSALHASGVVAGDLNEGNVLLAEGRAWLIDADSHQLPGHPCTVAHEKYLDPKLFGVDLSRTAALSEESDWYAFAVLAFSVWLYLHPFGGVHPALGTLARRAEARISALRPEVVKPKSAAPIEVLPDHALRWFERVFERDLREPMPARVLDLSWTRCACGLEHARLTCPACAKRGVLRARPMISRHGRVRAAVVIEGRVLAARSRGSLEYLVEHGGRLVREDGSISPVAAPGRVALAGRRTLIADGPSMITIDRGAVVERRRTGTFAQEAMFDACGAHAVTLDGDHLVDLEGARVGSILEGATVLSAGPSLGFGYYRASKLSHAFLWQRGRAGLTPIALPSIDGRLVSHRVYFDDRHVLVAWQELIGGRARAHLFLIDARGAVIASLSGRPEDSPLLAGTAGFALSGGRVLRAIDRGVLSVEADSASKTLLAGSLFVDAEPFVAEGCELLPGAGGSLYVVTENRITQLTLEGD